MRKTLHNRLEKLAVPELEELLRESLAKDCKNYILIYQILELLKSKTKPLPELSQQEIDDAMMLFEKCRPAPITQKKIFTWRMRLAITAAVLCLLTFFFPVASAVSFIQEIFAKWNDKFFWFETSETTATTTDTYVFQTDNPGLQQLYETVTELGITQPVVPMWLPEGYDEYMIDESIHSNRNKISACFKKSDKAIIYLIEQKENIQTESHKNFNEPKSWTIMDTRYFYFENTNRVKVVWTTGDYVMMIAAPIDYTTMYSIVKSIYYINEVNHEKTSN